MFHRNLINWMAYLESDSYAFFASVSLSWCQFLSAPEVGNLSTGTFAFSGPVLSTDVCQSWASDCLSWKQHSLPSGSRRVDCCCQHCPLVKDLCLDRPPAAWRSSKPGAGCSKSSAEFGCPLLSQPSRAKLLGKQHSSCQADILRGEEVDKGCQQRPQPSSGCRQKWNGKCPPSSGCRGSVLRDKRRGSTWLRKHRKVGVEGTFPQTLSWAQA